ncbi:MAG: hypothetical protein HUJ98_14495, partial [Bacteroidaceae bacterium]|nr:hypothetical protein [Bacteroidaceae bacterium]
MKASNISIKWKIFFGYLIFAIVLLGVLWLFQVVYLNEFYTVIKRREAREVLSSIETILEAEDASAQEQIDELAASKNMAVFITDNTGLALYNAEYIHNSLMSSMPYDLFLHFYQKAKDNGGYAELEYEGSQLKEEMEPVDPGKFVPDEGDVIFENAPSDKRLPYTIMEEERPLQDFRQNLGNEFAQSVIC